MRLVPLAVLLALAPAVEAQPPGIEYTGSGNPVDVAGRSGTVTTLGDPAGDPYLADFTFYERSDEPCAVAESDPHGPDALWDGCGGARRSPLRLEAVAPSPEVIAYRTVQIPGRGLARVLDDDGPWYDDHGQWALRKIRVCTNGRSGERGELVKGVEAVWTVNPFDAPEDQYTITRTARRTNCDDDAWSGWSECRGRRAAPTVRLHHKAVGGRRALVGVQLVCYRTHEG